MEEYLKGQTNQLPFPVYSIDIAKGREFDHVILYDVSNEQFYTTQDKANIRIHCCPLWHGKYAGYDKKELSAFFLIRKPLILE